MSSDSKGDPSAKNKKVLRPSERPKVEPVKRGILGNLISFVGNRLMSIGLDASARGLENLPEDGPYLLCVNHETFVDALFVLHFLPPEHFYKTSAIAGADLKEKYGFWGQAMMQYGRAIPIDRLHGHSTASIIAAVDMLKEGNILLIHPEGTRTHTGKLGKIHSGAALIAKRADVPMCPVFIEGGYEFWNRYMKWPSFRDENGKKRKIIVHFGAPIHPQNYKTTRQLSNALSEWMHEMQKHKIIPREFDDSGQAIVH